MAGEGGGPWGVKEEISIYVASSTRCTLHAVINPVITVLELVDLAMAAVSLPLTYCLQCAVGHIAEPAVFLKCDETTLCT